MASYLNQKLKTAIERQDERTVEQLLESGADPNAFPTQEDIAPIHLGSGISKSITSLLLKYGADPNLRTSDGITPLHIAATWGNKSIVKLLLHHRADIYIRDDEGFTPLDMAKKYEHEKCEIILKRHSHLLESQKNIQKRKLQHNPSLNLKTRKGRNVDDNQKILFDNEQTKDIKPRRSVLYRKAVQNQINRLCENREDFDIDVTSPDHPCVNITPKMQFPHSSTKHIRAYTEPMAESTSTPIRPRRSFFTANMQQRIDNFTDIGENVSIDVTSPDHPEIFLTPTVKSPVRKIDYGMPEKPLSPVMPCKSENSSSSDSDLYVTVNEGMDYVDKPLNASDMDKVKHSMTNKIDQLRNCLNKLNTPNPFTSNYIYASKNAGQVQDELNPRERDPSLDNLYSKQIHRKVSRPNHDVDVKLEMELPPKIISDNGKSSRKEKNSQYRTIEMNIGKKSDKKSCEKSKGSTREPIIDIQIQPDCKASNIKYNVKDKVLVGQGHQSKNKISPKYKILKHPEPQQRVRSKSEHKDHHFSQTGQNVKEYSRRTEDNIEKKSRQKMYSYPGGTVYLSHENQREKKAGVNGNTHPHILTHCDSRNSNKIHTGHSKNTFVSKSSENPLLSSYYPTTSQNYKSGGSTQQGQLPHSSRMMKNEKVSNEQPRYNQASLSDIERQIVPEKSINPTRGKRIEYLANSQQKVPILMKDRSESKYPNSHEEDRIFHQRRYMVVGQKSQSVGDKKPLLQKVIYGSEYNKATKLPQRMNTDYISPSLSPTSNIDPCQKHSGKGNRLSISSVTSTDTYYTCQSGLDTEDFYSCENGIELQNENTENYYFWDAGKSQFFSSLGRVTSALRNSGSSCFDEFEFDKDELIQALREFSLRDPNSSALKDTLVKSKSSTPNEILATTGEQYEEFDTALEMLSSSKLRPKNQVKLRSNLTYKYSSGGDKSQVIHAPSSKLDSSDCDDTFLLVCVPPGDKKFVSASSQQAFNRSDGITYDEVDQQNDEIFGLKKNDPRFLEPEFRNSTRKKNPLQQNSNDVDNETKNPFSLQFSKVLSELKQKTDLKAVQSQKKTCYRWQPPENLMNSSLFSDESYLNGNGRNTDLNSLKRRVGLELKNHPLVKSQKSAIDKSCDSHYISAVENGCLSSLVLDETSEHKVENCYDSVKEAKSLIKNLPTKNHLDKGRMLKPQKYIFRQNAVEHSNKISKKDLEYGRYFVPKENSIQSQNRKTRKQPFFKRHLNGNKSISLCRGDQDESVDCSNYVSFKTEQNDSGLSVNRDEFQELEQSVQPSVAHSCYISACQEGTPDIDNSCYASFQRPDSLDINCSNYVSVCQEGSPDVEHSRYVSVRREGSPDVDRSHYVSVRREGSPDEERSHYISVRREGSPDVEHSRYVSVRREGSPDEERSHYISVRREGSPDVEHSRYVSVRREGSPDEECSHYISVRREGSPDVEHSRYVSVRQEGSLDVDRSHYVSVRREGSPDEERSHYISVRREGSPDVEHSRYVSVRRESSPDEERSHYISVRHEGSPDIEHSRYFSMRREGSPDIEHSRYVSVRREGSPDVEHSHYVSVRREGSPDVDRSHYVSVRREGSPDVDQSHYVSLRQEGCVDVEQSHYVSFGRKGSPDVERSNYVSLHRDSSPEPENSRYVSVRREGSPEMDRSHYVSLQQDSLPDGNCSRYVSLHQENSLNSDQYISVCQDASLKRIPSKPKSKVPKSKERPLSKPQNGKPLQLSDEAVTLQKRYITPSKNQAFHPPTKNLSSFTKDEPNDTHFESFADNVTSSSHWQYVSTKSSAHNRSVTWQHPISTFDKVDAALVDSTDESLSWSPKKDGHSPQTIPLTSTSASEEVTSESISSDEFKRCLERKKFLSPEERTSMWVNGIYKSSLQEYFDADMSSILPVLNSHSSSDNGKDINCGATAANIQNPQIEPSAPPQSEVIGNGSFTENFQSLSPRSPEDISNVAVAGISGDKAHDITSSDYISLHPSLYPSLFDAEKPSQPKPKSNNQDNNNETNASSAAYVSFGSDPEPPPASVHCSPENTNNPNKFGFTQKSKKLCSVNVIPSDNTQEGNTKPFSGDTDVPFAIQGHPVNKGHQIGKSISTQTPILRIPPDPPHKSLLVPSSFRGNFPDKNRPKGTQKGWAKLKKFFTGKKIQGKVGDRGFISVDSNQIFLRSSRLPRLAEITSPSTDTSGTQTDPSTFYEPTFQNLKIVTSDEVSLSVNFSEQISDYSEKYPSSIVPILTENYEQVVCNKSDLIETCSSSGATSGSMERLLSPYCDDSYENDFDEVDCVQIGMDSIKEVTEDVTIDKDEPISAETKVLGETYKTKLSKKDKRRKSKDVEYLHIDPEMKVQFIERQISTENANKRQSNDSESTEIYDWKSFSKCAEDNNNDDDDEDDVVKPTLAKTTYWRTCGEKSADTKSNNVKLKKPLPDISGLTNAELRQALLNHGFPQTGPITPSTRQMYLKRLKSVSDGYHLGCSMTPPDYNAELSRALNSKVDWTDMIDFEEKMIQKFDNPKNLRKWREGNEKSSFNYLLLDPRITKNLPSRASKMSDELEAFSTFVKAIFYVGKGKRSRPYAHLYEAIKYTQGKFTKMNDKTSHIIEIWNSGHGVVSLHCFQNVIPVEAYSREACMVDAIGCSNLTNKKRGDYYGLTATWSLKLKRRMGVYLLHKALKIFLAEGERQIYPTDLR